MTYDNTNSGALFKNDKKQTDKHPDYKGSININGVDYWQSAWIKKDKSGNTYMSQSFQPKEQQTAVSNSNGGYTQTHNAGQVDDFSDDISFAPINDKLIA